MVRRTSAKTRAHRPDGVAAAGPNPNQAIVRFWMEDSSGKIFHRDSGDKTAIQKPDAQPR